jgi:DNA-binding Xre family transcriptional regulator
MMAKKLIRIKIDELVRAHNDTCLESEKLDRYKLADAVGCNYSTLANLNAGRVGKSTQILVALTDKLGCTLNDLVQITEV